MYETTLKIFYVPLESRMLRPNNWRMIISLEPSVLTISKIGSRYASFGMSSRCSQALRRGQLSFIRPMFSRWWVWRSVARNLSSATSDCSQYSKVHEILAATSSCLLRLFKKRLCTSTGLFVFLLSSFFVRFLIPCWEGSTLVFGLCYDRKPGRYLSPVAITGFDSVLIKCDSKLDQGTSVDLDRSFSLRLSFHRFCVPCSLRCCQLGIQDDFGYISTDHIVNTSSSTSFCRIPPLLTETRAFRRASNRNSFLTVDTVWIYVFISTFIIGILQTHQRPK